MDALGAGQGQHLAPHTGLGEDKVLTMEMEIKEAVCRAVCVFVQHMAVKVPDKAEFRREAAEAIVSLMGALPRELFSSCVMWFVR